MILRDGARSPLRVGDDREFVALITRGQERMIGLAYVLCGDRNVAEDAVAEAVARVYVRWRAGTIRDLPAYLRTAVVHEVYHRARGRAVERRYAESLRADRESEIAPDDLLVARSTVLQALQRLPVRQRMVVALRYLEDLSVEETATVMGISAGTVKSHLARANRTLRTQLTQPHVPGGER